MLFRSVAPFANGGQRDHRAAVIPLFDARGIAVRAVRRRRRFPCQSSRKRLLRACRGGGARRIRSVCARRSGRGKKEGDVRPRHYVVSFRALRGGAVSLCSPHRIAVVFLFKPRGRANACYPRSPFRRFGGKPFLRADFIRLPYGNGQGKVRGFFYADRGNGKIRIAMAVASPSFPFGRWRGDRFGGVLFDCFFPRFVLYCNGKTRRRKT